MRTAVLTTRVDPKILAALYRFFYKQKHMGNSSELMREICKLLHAILKDNKMLTEITSDDAALEILKPLKIKNRSQLLRDISIAALDKEKIADMIGETSSKDDGIDDLDIAKQTEEIIKHLKPGS